MIYRILIVANTHRIAQDIAQEHDLPPWKWKHAWHPRDFYGHNGVIFIHTGWREEPTKTTDENGVEHWEYPVRREIEILSQTGSTIVEVDR